MVRQFESPGWYPPTAGLACVVLTGLALSLLTPSPAIAGDALEPLDLIPADAQLCWKGLPLPDSDVSAPVPSAVGTLLDVWARIAGNPLDAKTQISFRIAETLSVVTRYPFAIALLDARAKPAGDDSDSRKVDQLKLVTVVKTRRKSEPFRKIIQKVVNEQTDGGLATLEVKKAGKWTYQELRDSRLPAWCVIAWGEIGDHFVISVGEGVWARIAGVAAGDETSLCKDKWVNQVRARHDPEPLIEIIVAVREIRARLDPFVHGRATAFFNAWESSNVDATYWALGFDGPALYCHRDSRIGSSTQHLTYADPEYGNPALLETVPPGSRYAIYRLRISRFLPQLIRAYYATRDEEDRKAAEALWKKIQEENGIDAERDALAHLGRTVVLHNYPQHPFRLPLAFTSLIQIREEPEKVRHTLETLCRAWQKGIENASGESGVACPYQLIRDDDGIWYFQLGPFATVAWTFTDRYIVTSWSPIALRDYLRKAGNRLATEPRRDPDEPEDDDAETEQHADEQQP